MSAPDVKKIDIWLTVAGYLTIKTTALSADSAVARMVKLVEEAQHQRSNTELLVEKIAKYYTPGIFSSKWFHPERCITCITCMRWCKMVLSNNTASRLGCYAVKLPYHYVVEFFIHVWRFDSCMSYQRLIFSSLQVLS